MDDLRLEYGQATMDLAEDKSGKEMKRRTAHSADNTFIGARRVVGELRELPFEAEAWSSLALVLMMRVATPQAAATQDDRPLRDCSLLEEVCP
jgi:hypothetical protein